MRRIILASALVAAFLTSCITVVVAPTPPPPTSPPPTYAPSTPIAPTPEPVKAWICVDLAYGFSRPDTNSPTVFQMSQRDGWYVWVYELRGNWYVVGNGNALAYMQYGTLCKDPPLLDKAISPDSADVAKKLLEMIDRNKGQ